MEIKKNIVLKLFKNPTGLSKQISQNNLLKTDWSHSKSIQPSNTKIQNNEIDSLKPFERNVKRRKDTFFS